MPKGTHQPKKRSRSKVSGFRVRMASKNGRLVLKARRAKGRKSLSA
ncbi:MAG TPA: 50S ribosomal protein L34 [Patescibacteria group bacterium]|nr:50S ribosomal protein L34 [Patescibacteria group bacterium]